MGLDSPVNLDKGQDGLSTQLLRDVLIEYLKSVSIAVHYVYFAFGA